MSPGGVCPARSAAWMSAKGSRQRSRRQGSRAGSSAEPSLPPAGVAHRRPFATFRVAVEVVVRGLFAKCRLTSAERNELFDTFLGRCRWIRIYFGWRPNLPDEGHNHLVELGRGNAFSQPSPQTGTMPAGGRSTAMAQQFDVVVEKDAEGFFVATVPALPGCHTQARSLDELMERVKEAIELCLDVQDAPPQRLDFVGLQRVTVEA